MNYEIVTRLFRKISSGDRNQLNVSLNRRHFNGSRFANSNLHKMKAMPNLVKNAQPLGRMAQPLLIESLNAHVCTDPLEIRYSATALPRLSQTQFMLSSGHFSDPAFFFGQAARSPSFIPIITGNMLRTLPTAIRTSVQNPITIKLMNHSKS
jgi:hypothetical protein